MDTLNPGAAVAPRWAHRGALVLLAALTATTLVAVRADRPHEPSPELATATSAAAARIRTLTLALDRLANGLRADDAAAVRHLVATQLAPATVDTSLGRDSHQGSST